EATALLIQALGKTTRSDVTYVLFENLAIICARQPPGEAAAALSRAIEITAHMPVGATAFGFQPEPVYDDRGNLVNGGPGSLPGAAPLASLFLRLPAHQTQQRRLDFTKAVGMLTGP